MYKAFLVLTALFFATPALAQPVQCSDRPAADSSNACANTRFVQNHGGGGSSTLTTNHIFVGNGSNIATDVAMTGDCSIVFAGGAITCTKSSGSTILGMAFQAPSAVSITGGTITGLPTPTLTADAATKGYVDTLVATGRPPLAPVRVATTGVLSNTPTYANGAAGVGATLTAGSVGVLTVDSVATVLNDRILVKDQASAFQNGPYSVTTAGTAGVAYVLTRATDADTAAELPNGLTMLVNAGTVNANSSWTLNQPAAITVGTTALPFVQTGSPVVSYWTLSGSDIYNNNAGKVSVGTSTPSSQRFTVSASTFGDGITINGTQDPGLRWMSNSGNAAARNWGMFPNFLAFGDFVVRTSNALGGDPDAAGTTRLAIDGTGNVGLGVPNPSFLLHLNRSVGADNAVGASLMLGRNSDTQFGGAIWDSFNGGIDYMALGAGWGFNPTSNPLMVLKASTNGAAGGVVGIGTVTPDVTAKLQVIQGSPVPVAVKSNAVKIQRTEAINVDTEGGDNAALDVRSDGNNTSGGAIIAQPVGIRTTAVQTGSGDSVGIFSYALNAGTGFYAAISGFFLAQATSPSTGAVALGLAVDNSTGTSRPFAFSGSLYFVGVDSPCSGNAGCSAAFISRNSGQAWDVGFGVQSGSVSGSAFISPGFRVDPSGNETALTNTATSDERLKDIHGPFNRGLAEIIQVNPILYNWKESPDKPALGGVSAQDVRRVIPEAVSEIDAEGHLGVSDRPLVAALINSVKELKSANDNLRACQASWRCRLFGP